MYVMNVTDVDDKIILRARRNHLLSAYTEEVKGNFPALLAFARKATEEAKTKQQRKVSTPSCYWALSSALYPFLCCQLPISMPPPAVLHDLHFSFSLMPLPFMPFPNIPFLCVIEDTSSSRTRCVSSIAKQFHTVPPSPPLSRLPFIYSGAAFESPLRWPLRRFSLTPSPSPRIASHLSGPQPSLVYHVPRPLACRLRRLGGMLLPCRRRQRPRYHH